MTIKNCNLLNNFSFLLKYSKIPFMTFSLSISSGMNLQNFDECMNGQKRRQLGITLLSFLPKTDLIKIMFSKLIISNATKIRNETNS